MKTAYSSTEQKNNIPSTVKYRHHLIVFSVVGLRKIAKVYRGIPLQNYMIGEHSFIVSDWDSIEAWAREVIDLTWLWYMNHREEEENDL